MRRKKKEWAFGSVSAKNDPVKDVRRRNWLDPGEETIVISEMYISFTSHNSAMSLNYSAIDAERRKSKCWRDRLPQYEAPLGVNNSLLVAQPEKNCLFLTRLPNSPKGSRGC